MRAKRLLLAVRGSQQSSDPAYGSRRHMQNCRAEDRRRAPMPCAAGKVSVARSPGAGEGWPPQTQRDGRKGRHQEQSEREGQRLRHNGCSPTGPSCRNWQGPCASTCTSHPGMGFCPATQPRAPNPWSRSPMHSAGSSGSAALA